ncbi:unnamed protein product [Cyprideis torosa]|uniref:Uncharacterized protein n=1 Tax=Cyprideis torosa TaxID=163714 RepID=A0A7R8ZKL0_9CRUS|nr:unnamed protein product [Cyprideis torosa]CAG0889616.1 unnamed protein product [Cyprideis torosa]
MFYTTLTLTWGLQSNGARFFYEEKSIVPDFGVTLIYVPKDKGSIFRQKFWHEIQRIDKIILSIEVPNPGEFHLAKKFNITIPKINKTMLTFEDTCYHFGFDCVLNDILNVTDLIPAIRKGEVLLTFPNFLHPNTNRNIQTGGVFGSPKLDERGVILDAKALKIQYRLPPIIWAREFGRQVLNFTEHYQSEDLDVVFKSDIVGGDEIRA